MQILIFAGQQVVDGLSVSFVRPCANVTTRFVKGDDQTCTSGNRLAIHRDMVFISDFSRQFRDSLAVDHHPAIQDDLFATTPRAMAAEAEVTIETHGSGSPYSGLVFGRLVIN